MKKTKNILTKLLQRAKSHRDPKSVGLNIAFFFLIGLVAFQNCAPARFQTQLVDVPTRTLSSTTTCESSPDTRSVPKSACPAGASGMVMEVQQWLVTVCTDGKTSEENISSALSYAGCTCTAIAGQTFNQTSKMCECPAGKVVSGGACVTPVNPTPTPTPPPVTCSDAIVGKRQVKGSCPVNSTGQIFENLTVKKTTCTDGKVTEVVQSSTLDYSGCSCTITGQVINVMNGQCECTGGKTVVGTQCLANQCQAGNKPPTSDSALCDSPLTGNKSRSRTVSCSPSTLQWITSDWSDWNYGSCACPYPGQIINAATGACSCPSGAQLKDGQCRTTCNPDTKPSDKDPIACPEKGNATQNYMVTCDTNTLDWVRTATSKDYSTCSCNASSQVASPANGVCSCPNPSDTLRGGNCVKAECDVNAKPSERESLTCPEAGTAFQTRTVTCNKTAAAVWEYTAWVPNYSGCTCAIEGQIANNTNGACACPTGQSVQTPSVGGQYCSAYQPCNGYVADNFIWFTGSKLKLRDGTTFYAISNAGTSSGYYENKALGIRIPTTSVPGSGALSPAHIDINGDPTVAAYATQGQPYCDYTCTNGSWLKGSCLPPPPPPPVTPCPDCGPDGQTCFTPETLVTMFDGSKKKIVDIKIGDKVKSGIGKGFNTVTGFDRTALAGRSLMGFKGDEKPFFTPEHPFLTKRGWRSFDPTATESWHGFKVEKMQDDDFVQYKGQWKSAKDVIESKENPNVPTVYNLLLDGDHTYIANDYVVHNKDL